MARPLPLCALALGLALAIAGCGGGSSSTQSGGSASPPTAQSGSSPGQGQPARGGAEGSKGGEASIEEFGKAAEGAERAAILAAYTGYLDVLARKDYAGACGYLSAKLHEGLRQLAGKALADKGCAAVLPRLLAPSAPAMAEAQARGKVTRVRAAGERAFVVFQAPGAKLYQMPMAREGGEWRVASAVADVLVPELSSSGAG